ERRPAPLLSVPLPGGARAGHWRTDSRSGPALSAHSLAVRRGSGGTVAYPAVLIVMRFTGTDSGGNSPKSLFAARFEQNLFNGDRSALAEAVAVDCVLQIVSADGASTHTGAAQALDAVASLSSRASASGHLEAAITHGRAAAARGRWQQSADRSEEHTSELQSRFDLVCRLLLEKKKKSNEHGEGM